MIETPSAEYVDKLVNWMLDNLADRELSASDFGSAVFTLALRTIKLLLRNENLEEREHNRQMILQVLEEFRLLVENPIGEKIH